MIDHELLDNSSTINVLFVESDDESRCRCVERLAKSCSGLIVASGVHDALIAAERKDIDILVTEVDLYGKDGFYIVDAVKKNNPSCMLIVMSSRQDPETFQKAIDARTDKFLMKPFKPEDLEDAIITLSHKVFVLKFYNEDAYYDGLLDSDDFTNISTAIDLIREGIEQVSHMGTCRETIESTKVLHDAIELLKSTLKSDS